MYAYTHHTSSSIIIVIVELSSDGQIILLVFFKSLLFFVVRLLIKVGKQEQKHDTMQTYPYHESFWIVAGWNPHKLELVNKNGNKLGLKI